MPSDADLRDQAREHIARESGVEIENLQVLEVQPSGRLGPQDYAVAKYIVDGHSSDTSGSRWRWM